MEISLVQYVQIESCLRRQRGNVSLSNLQVPNAILYLADHGCNWRGLPRRFGNLHTSYTRMNRWAKLGVLDRVFAQLQHAQIVRIKIESVALDSTVVKAHPDGTGPLNKGLADHLQVPPRLDHQDTYGCRECSNGHYVFPVARTCGRRPRGAHASRCARQSELAHAADNGTGQRG